MRTEGVQLKPKGAFHLGVRGIGYEGTDECLHADTLFSALCAAWLLLFGEKELRQDLLPDGEEKPPFLLSSAFPYAGSVRFYPKPLFPVPFGEQVRTKEVRWVSERVFRAWLFGEPIYDLERIHEGRVLLTSMEAGEIAEVLGERDLRDIWLWGIGRVARVALDALTHASELWHFGRLLFRQGCGFWFAIRFLRDDLAEKFWAALRLMGDEGIGGDRTTGHGLFECEPMDLPDELQPQQSQRFLTLAPLFPKRHEVSPLFNDGCAYHWLVRSGWVGGVVPTPFRRKTVRMLAEGSVLWGDATSVYGRFAEITPDPMRPLHPVYRYGFAFPIAVR